MKLGAISAVSSKIGQLSESILGEAGRFDPFSSLKAQLGLATNPYNELAFKGMARKSFQFNFTFAPTSPQEATMMQNIIQSFRFHSLPELSSSTLQYFAPHEVEVKFYRTSLQGKNSKGENQDLVADTFGRVTDFTGQSTLERGATSVQNQTTEGGILGFGGTTKQVESQLVENTEIPRIGRCFVTNVSLNYAPDAKSSFLIDGVPTKVEMNLTLSQALTMNRQFVLKGF